jgi:hypothetical protein
MKEDSQTQNHKKENKNSSRTKRSRIFEKLDLAQISELEGLKGASEDSESEKKEEKKEDSDSLPILGNFLGSERTKKIKSKKSEILMGIGIIIGLLFIIYGVKILMGPIEKVADNIIFGEQEVFSVFLIFVGIIIIAISLVQKFMGKSFFKEIDNDLSYNEKSSHSAKNNIKKDNINRDKR